MPAKPLATPRVVASPSGLLLASTDRVPRALITEVPPTWASRAGVTVAVAELLSLTATKPPDVPCVKAFALSPLSAFTSTLVASVTSPSKRDLTVLFAVAFEVPLPTPTKPPACPRDVAVANAVELAVTAIVVAASSVTSLSTQVST